MVARAPRFDSWFVFALALAISSGAQAADEGLVQRAQAAQLVAEGRCDQALPLLERARARSPQDAVAARLQGECLLQAKRYREALEPLEEAVRLDPESADAALYLGMARYHTGDPTGADEVLTRAEALDPDNAQIALYRGLALMDLARTDEAAERFARASSIDPDRAEPIASYYGGLAQQSSGRSAEARQSLERVSELAPGTEWDRLAQQALLAEPTPAEPLGLRRWIAFEVGLAYDSNVALVGSDASQPGFRSNQDDGRGEWGVEAGHELYRTETWGGGVLASYYGNAYFHETDYDQTFVSAAFWVDREIAENTWVRFQPMFGASFYDYDDYLRFYGFRADLLHDWEHAGSSDLWVRYTYNDFLYDIPGNTSQLRHARNRDGNEVWIGYDHSYPLTESTTLQGGPFFSLFDTKGSEYDSWGVGGWLGVVQTLPWELTAEVSGSYAFAQYDHPSTYLQPGENNKDRHDDIWIAQATLERPITEHLAASIRFTYLDDDSNTDVFDYDRYIAGFYLTLAFGD